MFLAVAHGRNPDGTAALVNVIAAADWINHAIPVEDELRRGLNRLIDAGFVGEDRGTFRLTAAGESILAKVRRRASAWTQLNRLATAFAEIGEPSEPSWTPAPIEIEAAIDAYLRQMADL